MNTGMLINGIESHATQNQWVELLNQAFQSTNGIHQYLYISQKGGDIGVFADGAAANKKGYGIKLTVQHIISITQEFFRPEFRGDKPRARFNTQQLSILEQTFETIRNRRRVKWLYVAPLFNSMQNKIYHTQMIIQGKRSLPTIEEEKRRETMLAKERFCDNGGSHGFPFR